MERASQWEGAMPHRPSLNVFLIWLPEAGRTSLAKDIDKISPHQYLYNVFLNLFTGLTAPSKYVPFQDIS
jgi:hypothetical protein